MPHPARDHGQRIEERPVEVGAGARGDAARGGESRAGPAAGRARAPGRGRHHLRPAADGVSRRQALVTQSCAHAPVDWRDSRAAGRAGSTGRGGGPRQLSEGARHPALAAGPAGARRVRRQVLEKMKAAIARNR